MHHAMGTSKDADHACIDSAALCYIKVLFKKVQRQKIGEIN